MRLSWQVIPSLSVAAVGQDLHEPRHLEWASEGAGVLIERRWFVSLTWQ